MSGIPTARGAQQGVHKCIPAAARAAYSVPMSSGHDRGGDQQERLEWMADEFRTARNRRLSQTNQLPVAQPDPEHELPAAAEIVLTAPVAPIRR